MAQDDRDRLAQYVWRTAVYDGTSEGEAGFGVAEVLPQICP